jgi:hypothetical protein
MNFENTRPVFAAMLFAIASVATSSSAIIDISSGPNGWGCSQCNDPNNVPPGTLVNLVNAGETGPLQLTFGAGTYTITNAATTGN